MAFSQVDGEMDSRSIISIFSTGFFSGNSDPSPNSAIFSIIFYDASPVPE
jgi:hypothetical protein